MRCLARHVCARARSRLPHRCKAAPAGRRPRTEKMLDVPRRWRNAARASIPQHRASCGSYRANMGVNWRSSRTPTVCTMRCGAMRRRRLLSTRSLTSSPILVEAARCPPPAFLRATETPHRAVRTRDHASEDPSNCIETAPTRWISTRIAGEWPWFFSKPAERADATTRARPRVL